MNSDYAVIMAGGRGERFWPLSRLETPKHLLPIVGDKPMLAQTVDRLLPVFPVERILVITNREQKEAVARVCPGLPAENIIGEPVGRDTAAAVALAATVVGRRAPSAVFAILPADHVIHDAPAFQQVIRAALEAAREDGALVTIGIRPEYPATGYGYVERGEKVSAAADTVVYEVKGFREKPDASTAEDYLAGGRHYWNAGMFFWSVDSISAALREFTPSLWQAMLDLADAWGAEDELEPLLEQRYPALEKISVDYAIMEKARKVRMIEAAFDWDDVGEWPAIARHYPEDKNGNVVRGQAWFGDAGGHIVRTEPGHTVALIGVDDLIVVHTPDATLICPKDKAQQIKDAVKRISGDSGLSHLV